MADVDKRVEDTESEEEEDEEDMPPPPAAYLSRGPRTSVSAEAYGEWNQKVDFVPIMHDKSDEQRARIQGVLGSCFLFQALDRADVEILIGAMVERQVAEGERIIREGEDGEEMFVIERGAFDCVKVLGGEERVLKRCSAGDFFGELALLYNCPRAATVVATASSVLWRLDRNTFNHIVRDASIKKRDAYTEFLQSVPVLETLGTYERLQLADSFRKLFVAAGSTVITQGEEGDRFYLVEEGELAVTKDGQVVLEYKRGGYFGELALLQNDVRKATVTAKCDSRLLWMDRRTFTLLLGTLEEVMKTKAAQYA